MANKNIEEVGVKFTADGAVEFQKSVKDINTEMYQARANYRLATAEMDKNATATEKLTAKQKLLQDQVSIQERKVEALRRELEKETTSETKNESAIANKKKELTYAEAALKTYETKLEETTAELKQHSEWTDKASTSLKDFGEKAENAGKKASVATAAVAAGGIAAAKTAGDLEAAANRYIATTGKTAEETGKYKAALDAIYKNGYGENYDDISRAMGTINNIMGDMPVDTLQTVAEKAFTLQDAFDIDLQEGVRGVNALMTQFGISADEAFDLLAKGAQNGLNQNGDLADQVAEYSVYFSDLGYTAGQFFDTMVSGAQDGTFQIDYLNDVIKEFGIRTKDNSESTKAAFTALGLDADKMTGMFAAGGDQATAAMQMVNDALFGMDDSVKQNEIGVALYGTKWEDLGISAVSALTSVDGSLGSTQGAMDTLQDTMYSGFNVQWDALRRTFTSVVATVSEALLPALSSILEKVKGVAESFAHWFAGLSEGEKKTLLIIVAVIAAVGPLLVIIGKLSTGIGAIIKIFPALKTGIAGINTVMSANPILLIVAAIAAVIAILVTLYNKCEWFRNAVDGVWKWLKNAFSAIVTWFKTAFADIGNALSFLYTGIIKPVIDKATHVFQSFRNFFSGLKNWLTNAFSNIGSSVKNTFSNIGNALTNLKNNTIKPVVEKAVNIFKGWGSYLKETFLTGFSAVMDNLKEHFPALYKNIKAVWENIKGIFSGIVDFVKNVFSGNWKAAWQSVVDIFGNVFGMIGNLVKMPINAVISIINKAIDGINKLAINIPDWVPLVGGKKLGFSIPNIPALAAGGELVSGMAIVAEAGPELLHQQGGRTIVTPLSGNSSHSATISLSEETLNRLVDLFIKAMIDAGFGTVIAKLDRREVLRVVRGLS